MPHQRDSSGSAVGNDTASTLPDAPEPTRRDKSTPPDVVVLVVVWAQEDFDTVGSMFVVPKGDSSNEYVIGREAKGFYRERRLQLTRQRPGIALASPPIASRHISRTQLGVRYLPHDRFEIRRLGRCPVRHNGMPVETAVVSVGDTVELGDHLMLLAVRRQAWLCASISQPSSFQFGEPDPVGIVGESAAIWQLRHQIGFISGKDVNTIVFGESGTGKELVAQALHAGSSRAARALVARSAATFPESLVDAELFGNMQGYPNPGMKERLGLVGEADGSTLYLDEIGELPPAMQAHLLRVLDRGEYHRLGESRSRRANLRLIAATNRALSELKPDFLARIPFRIHVPSLNERREDIPFLCRALLRRIAAKNPDILERFCDSVHGQVHPRISQALMRELLQHSYSTNVRELETYLWRSIVASLGDCIDTFTKERPDSNVCDAKGSAGAAKSASSAVDVELIQRVLDDHRGHIERARLALGVSNRHILTRLITKYGLRAGRSWTRAET